MKTNQNPTNAGKSGGSSRKDEGGKTSGGGKSGNRT
jgi:hypothetical protein